MAEQSEVLVDYTPVVDTDVVRDPEHVEVAGTAKQEGVTDPFAPVRVETMQVRGVDIPRMAVVAEPDEEDADPVFISDVSSGYKLIPNERAAQIVRDVIYRSQVGQPKHVETYWNGKRFLDRHVIDEVFIEEDDEENKRLSLGIQAINSYDGSLQFGVEFFAFRFACTNQFHFGNRIGSFTFRHVVQSTDDMISDAVDQLRSGANQFIQLAPYIQAMQDVPITLDDLVDWQDVLQREEPKWPASKTGDVVTALTKYPRNMWGLLNAFCDVTSHQIRGQRGGRLSANACDYAMALVDDRSESTT